MSGGRLIAPSLVVLALLATTISSPYLLNVAIYAAVLALLGLSVALVFGGMGYISFGHAAFFGLGAYAAGLLSLKLGINFWLAAVLAGIPAAALGALVGLVSMRLGGAYFAIASLTIAEILRLIGANWIDFTRGPLGLQIPPPSVPMVGSIGLTPAQGHLMIALLALAACVFTLRRLFHAPSGRAWLAVRESPNLAESVGIPTVRWRIVNLTLSGAMAGWAGALLVPKILVLTPDLFSASYSATALLVVVLGGKATLVGPLIGGLLFAVIPEALRFVDDWRLAIFALILLGCVRLLPDGVAPFLSRRRPAPAMDGAHAARMKYTETGPTPNGELLSVLNVTRNFHGLRAVSDVSFNVQAREIVGLIGPNGAGKTTCLNIMSGFLAPSGGAVQFCGKDTRNLAPYRLARRGMVRTFQQSTLFGNLSVLDNVVTGTGNFSNAGIFALPFGGRYRKAERQRHAYASLCLDRVGLRDRADARAGDLAYGEQRLLSVAVALAARPILLLLDEPAAGLNQTEAGRLAAVLRTLREEGLTILIVDHNLVLLMALCDRLVVLHHGELVASGTPNQVRSDPTVVSAYLGSAE